MYISGLFGRRQRARTGHTEVASHDLLVRAGWVRQHAAGIYSYLTPCLKALRRIERIVREEMESTGAQEILMPVVHSAEVWKASGRYDAVDDTLVRFRDRRGHDMVLGMTHEEIVAQLAAGELRSYRDADVIVYQIQAKFRDEARPRGGLFRTREFIMKDAYSLHVEAEGLRAAYGAMSDAYTHIFRRTGLADVHRVRSATGDMGGDTAHEFMLPLAVGDDAIATCSACGSACNVELLSGPRCDACGGELQRVRAVEVGNIFQLGTRYSEALGARVVDAHGRRRPLLMGSYGIGVGRLLAALIECCHDRVGIALPAAVAPFDAHVIGIDANGRATAVGIHEGLCAAGLDALVEDRNVRASVAFADADLIGATLRIVVGGRSAERGRAEIRERRTGAVHDVAEADIVAATRRVVEDVKRRERVVD